METPLPSPILFQKYVLMGLYGAVFRGKCEERVAGLDPECERGLGRWGAGKDILG